MEKRRRPYLIATRLTGFERALVTAAAEAGKKSMATFVRETVLPAATSRVRDAGIEPDADPTAGGPAQRGRTNTCPVESHDGQAIGRSESTG